MRKMLPDAYWLGQYRQKDENTLYSSKWRSMRMTWSGVDFKMMFRWDTNISIIGKISRWRLKNTTRTCWK
jgi:hypothetical protein